MALPAAMTSTPLDSAVRLMQKAHNPSPPWSFLAPRLASLLNLYSTGLSLSVACSELGDAWCKHERLRKNTPPLVHTGTITRVALGPPEVWLLSLQDSTFVACFPPERLCCRFGPGVVISFADADLEQSGNREDAAVLRVARGAFKESGSKDSEANSFKLHQEQLNSQSPVDVKKFSARESGVQQADTPSQVDRLGDVASSLSRVLLPNAPMLIDSAAVGVDALVPGGPVEAFSLQRIWNERSLTPAWVHAEVVEHVSEPDVAVRLRDLSVAPGCDQPSVLWKVPRESKMFAVVLQPGYRLSLQNCSVQPTGSSFDLLSTPETTCFYRAPEERCNLQTSATNHDDGDCGRATKRRRVDPELSQSTNAVSVSQVVNLSAPMLQDEFSVWSVATCAPVVEESYLTAVYAEHELVVRVVGHAMAKKAASVEVGDQVLFCGLKWAASSSASGSETGGGWTASAIYNLSTMSGILYSPFVRRTVPLASCLARNASTGMDGFYRTFHVFVDVRAVELNEAKREVVLSVVDQVKAKPQLVYRVLQPIDQNRGSINMSRSQDRSCSQNGLRAEVVIRSRGFIQLFGQTSKEKFWNSDSARVLEQCRDRIIGQSWLMTLKCCSVGENSLGQLLELCECVPGGV